MKYLKLFNILLAFSIFTTLQAQEVDRLRLSYNKKNAASVQTSMTVSSDGKLIAFAYEDKTIKILNAINGRVIKKLIGVHEDLFEIRFSQTTLHLISVGNGNQVAFINTKSGEVDKTLILTDDVSRVAISRRNNYVAFGMMNCQVDIYDLDNYSLISKISRDAHHVSAIDFDPANDRIAIAVMPKLKKKHPVTIHDINGGGLLFESEKGIYLSVEYNIDGSSLYLSGLKGTSATIVDEYNTSTRTVRTIYKKANMWTLALYTSVELVGNNLLTVSIDRSFEVIDITTGEKIYTTKSDKAKLAAAFSKMGIDRKRIFPLYDGKSYLINYSDDNINQIYNTDSKNIGAFIYSDANDDLVVASRDGRIDGDADAMSRVFWSQRKSNKAVSLEATFDQFYTPGLLPLLLSADAEIADEKELEKAIELSPLCSITVPDSVSTITSSKVSLQVTASPQGDPIKAINLFVNGKRINTDARGFKQSSETQTFDLTVLPGKNIITAVAVSEGGYQSLYDQVVVNYQGQTAKSNLYVVAIGIDIYRNPNYNLNYALADAQALTDELKGKSADIFGNIDIQFISNSEATKVNIMNTLNDIKSRIQQQDVFVFYYAGHGVMNEGTEEVAPDFFLALYDVTQLYGREEMLAEKGISAAELRNYFSEVPAQKQLIILDACQSGGAVETFARRGAAEEKAMIQLARSAGVVLMASTGSEQYATEFEQLGHGVFTYALLEGMSGKADGGTDDKKITVKELESYMNDAVPELTEKYKGTMQFPRSWARGQDFPLVIVE